MKDLTKSQLTKLSVCPNTEALLAELAKMGIKVSAEEAKALFDKLHLPQVQELSDDNLAKVAGGSNRENRKFL